MLNGIEAILGNTLLDAYHVDDLMDHGYIMDPQFCSLIKRTVSCKCAQIIVP